jgi:Raf kinase inhibitor-like YbhB/YbcL family protein
MNNKFFFLPLLFILIISCGKKDENKTTTADTKQKSNEIKQDTTMGLKITSSAFEAGGMIPAKYTCDAENMSPPLSWGGAPEKTKSFALICDDPDAPAGTWVHWVVYNIPESSKELLENIQNDKKLTDGTLQGTNDFGKTGYGGPCPPSGTHRYFFKLYALDAMLTIQGNATKSALLEAMKGHILAQGELIGKYSRK